MKNPLDTIEGALVSGVVLLVLIVLCIRLFEA